MISDTNNFKDYKIKLIFLDFGLINIFLLIFKKNNINFIVEDLT